MLTSMMLIIMMLAIIALIALHRLQSFIFCLFWLRPDKTHSPTCVWREVFYSHSTQMFVRCKLGSPERSNQGKISSLDIVICVVHVWVSRRKSYQHVGRIKTTLSRSPMQRPSIHLSFNFEDLGVDSECWETSIRSSCPRERKKGSPSIFSKSSSAPT